MKIQGVEMEYQNSETNKDLIMTSPPWQDKPDTIKQYGCLTVALYNAYILFNNNPSKNIKSKTSFSDFIEMIKLNNGFNYLYQKNFIGLTGEDLRVKIINRESFLIYDVVKKILNIQEIDHDYNGAIDIESVHDYYIVKTKFNNTGHYSLIIGYNGGLVKYLDSYDGKIKETSNYLKIKRVVFR